MEHNDDIEQLLQQYGRQQQLASQVRHLAHVQARRRTWVACTLLVLLGSVGAVNRISTSSSIEPQPLVAKQVRPAVATPASTADVPPATAPTLPHANHIIAGTTNDLPLPPTGEEPPLPAALPQEDTAAAPDRQDSILPYLPNTLPPSMLVADISPVDLQAQSKQSSRLHFISSVTASATPFHSTGSAGEAAEPQSNSLVNDAYSSFSPRYTFAADMGAAFTVSESDRRHFDIGFTLGAFYHQGELLKMIPTHMQGVDGNESEIVIMQSEDTYSTFSLYASLPFVFNIAPRDNKSVGWSLSLTPAHSIVLSHMLGGIDLNPWRLTLGVGILFPTKFPRRVSLVGNLLPLYTSQPVHEIGIEIGF